MTGPGNPGRATSQETARIGRESRAPGAEQIPLESRPPGGRPAGSPLGGSAIDEAPGVLGSADATSAPRRALLRLVRRQEFAFMVVGAVNTGMGIGLTVVWLAALGDSVPPSVAVAAAYVTGIGIAFVLHRRLVFRVRGRVVRDFLGFAAVNCGGMVANAVLLELAVTVLGFARTPAAVVVMGAVAAGTFFGHRYISFRRPVV